MSKSQPPPPDKGHIPRYVNQAVVECVYSQDSRLRAVLVRDGTENLRIRCERWDVSEWENSSFAFWSPVGHGTTITDTVENARLLARERLRELGELETK
jgi:hypothetical protein